MCLNMPELWVKLAEQNEHWYGFSPVWVIMCFLISAEYAMILGQYGQRYLFEPSLIATCKLKNKKTFCISLF